MAVTTPICRVAPMIRYPTMSHSSIITAPVTAAAGMSMRLSGPTSILAMWGDTRPMNPMTPVKLTMPAATRDMSARQRMRMASTSMPRDLAKSSPAFMAFRTRDMANSAANPTTVAARRTGICSQVVIPMLPTLHVYTLDAEFGSALSIR